jgi:hypothetical protein
MKLSIQENVLNVGLAWLFVNTWNLTKELAKSCDISLYLYRNDKNEFHRPLRDFLVFLLF